MRSLLIGLLVLSGCGGEMTNDPAPPPPLVPPSLLGVWEATVNSCVISYAFARGQRYEIDVACPLSDGTIGLDAEIGTYSQTATKIDFTPTEATCATTSPQPYFLSYSLVSGRLTLIATNDSATLVQIVPTGSVVTTFGCWSMGSFTPGPLAPL